VIDDGYYTVAPVEEWLEAHRHLWSPNTVRGYATALAHWWTFLEARGETEQWHEVGVPTVTGFLSWLRNGRTVEHALVALPDAPAPETLEALLAALISFYTARSSGRCHGPPTGGGTQVDLASTICLAAHGGPRVTGLLIGGEQAQGTFAVDVVGLGVEPNRVEGRMPE